MPAPPCPLPPGTKKKSAKKTSAKKKTAKKKSAKKKSAKKKTAKKKTAKKKSAKKTSAKKKTAKKKTAKKKTAKKKSAKKTSAKKKTAKKRAGKASNATVALVRQVRKLALAFPEAYEEFPWDHSVAKVRKKVFAFLDRDDVVGDKIRFSLKLPHSNEIALALPFATPTGYGLARGGWVSFSFTVAQAPPITVIADWLAESYRAVAPKRLAAQLDVP